MEKNINRIGVISLIVFFLFFYLIATVLLDKRKIEKNVEPQTEVEVPKSNNYDNEKNIVSNLYKDVKILYDVVNNKFKVSQDDAIVIGEIVYKKIINFHEVMDNLFTQNGTSNYIKEFGSYFASFEDEYYLAGNLVSYQTYKFRGDETNIYITDSNADKIEGIIYERWTSNYQNTLATFVVVKENDKWLVDSINILATG